MCGIKSIINMGDVNIINPENGPFELFIPERVSDRFDPGKGEKRVKVLICGDGKSIEIIQRGGIGGGIGFLGRRREVVVPVDLPEHIALDNRPEYGIEGVIARYLSDDGSLRVGFAQVNVVRLLPNQRLVVRQERRVLLTNP